MTTLITTGIVLVIIIAISVVYRITRYRRPMWGVCSECEYRCIYINGMGRWLHVVGDSDPLSDAHSPVIRRGSVHLRRA